MDVNILHLVEGARQAKGLTVIIDVFRAFSVEAMLMHNHAEKIIPVGSVEEAFAYRCQHPDAILCGERGGIMCDGFDYGNSPSQVADVDFTGKTVVHTTSAGVQGIVNATGADEILGGSLMTAKAIATYIRQKRPETVSLVAMGLAGVRQTEEDELCALYIKSLLEGTPLPDLEQQVFDLRYTEGAKFFDPQKQSVFPEQDFHLCTMYDRFDFVLRLRKTSGAGCGTMERVPVL